MDILLYPEKACLGRSLAVDHGKESVDRRPCAERLEGCVQSGGVLEEGANAELDLG